MKITFEKVKLIKCHIVEPCSDQVSGEWPTFVYTADNPVMVGQSWSFVAFPGHSLFSESLTNSDSRSASNRT